MKGPILLRDSNDFDVGPSEPLLELEFAIPPHMVPEGETDAPMVDDAWIVQVKITEAMRGGCGQVLGRTLGRKVFEFTCTVHQPGGAAPIELEEANTKYFNGGPHDHSDPLAITADSIPDCTEVVTARTDDSEVSEEA